MGADLPSPTNFLETDDQLSDDELLVRGTVRDFVTSNVIPHIAGWYDQGAFPRELIKPIACLGLLGMQLTGYGCAGTSSVHYGLAAAELEAGDTGLRSFVSVQGSLAMHAIWAFGSEQQKLRWLPGMASGDIIGCFALTEPEAGSDPSSMRAAARRDGSDWIINATKMWITNGSMSDLAVVWARDSASGLIRGFLVPTDAAGFDATAIPRKLSLRASATAELRLVDVRVPADAMLPQAQGIKAPLACLNEARFGILWGVTGAARTCFEEALWHAKTREQFGVPIARHQLVQAKLVEMLIEVSRAQLLALHLGRRKDSGNLHHAQVSLGKLDNVRSALAVARTARTVLGASGIVGDYASMRHAANLESVLTYEGTHEIHTLILGQAITGIAAFSADT